MTMHETLLEDALKLLPVDRVNLVEELMFSEEQPHSELDSIWERAA